MAVEGVRKLENDDAARLGQAQRATHRLSGRLLLCRAKGETKAWFAGRG